MTYLGCRSAADDDEDAEPVSQQGSGQVNTVMQEGTDERQADIF